MIVLALGLYINLHEFDYCESAPVRKTCCWWADLISELVSLGTRFNTVKELAKINTTWQASKKSVTQLSLSTPVFFSPKITDVLYIKQTASRKYKENVTQARPGYWEAWHVRDCHPLIPHSWLTLTIDHRNLCWANTASEAYSASYHK